MAETGVHDLDAVRRPTASNEPLERCKVVVIKELGDLFMFDALGTGIYPDEEDDFGHELFAALELPKDGSVEVIRTLDPSVWASVGKWPMLKRRMLFSCLRMADVDENVLHCNDGSILSVDMRLDNMWTCPLLFHVRDAAEIQQIL